MNWRGYERKGLWTDLRYYARIRLESLRKTTTIILIHDLGVPAKIGTGYPQSASQASPHRASLLGYRKFSCDNCVITSASDKCFGLAGWQVIDGASLHGFSRHTASESYSIFLSFHHAEQWRATFCCKGPFENLQTLPVMGTNV